MGGTGRSSSLLTRASRRHIIISAASRPLSLSLSLSSSLSPSLSSSLSPSPSLSLVLEAVLFGGLCGAMTLVLRIIQVTCRATCSIPFHCTTLHDTCTRRASYYVPLRLHAPHVVLRYITFARAARRVALHDICTRRASRRVPLRLHAPRLHHVCSCCASSRSSGSDTRYIASHYIAPRTILFAHAGALAATRSKLRYLTLHRIA